MWIPPLKRSGVAIMAKPFMTEFTVFSGAVFDPRAHNIRASASSMITSSHRRHLTPTTSWTSPLTFSINSNCSKMSAKVHLLESWQGDPDSNRDQRFWRPPCYQLHHPPMDRVMGIAPTLRPWEGRVLLLHHTREMNFWCGLRESNSFPQLGRLVCYRNTSPAK